MVLGLGFPILSESGVHTLCKTENRAALATLQHTLFTDNNITEQIQALGTTLTLVDTF